MSGLQVLQNKAARIILSLFYRSSASAALGRINWVTLKIRRKLQRLIFIYKCRNNLSSHRFDLRYHQDFHGYNSRCKFNIRNPLLLSANGRAIEHHAQLLIYFASNDWNDLNHDTRRFEARDIATFRKLIKERGTSLK